MAFSILISDPDMDFAKKTKQFLEENSYEVDIVKSGKDCQLRLYKKKYLAVILDVDTVRHSGPEVLKYIRLNVPSVKVILTFESKKRLDSLDVTKKQLTKLGASDILVKPYLFSALLKSIEGGSQFTAWKDLKGDNLGKEPEQVDENDEAFTKIKIEDFYAGNTNIFDCYIKMSPNKYIKILHKGDFFEESRITSYSSNENITHLYFRTRDRATYINFVNDALAQLLKKKGEPFDKKMKMTQDLTEKYIEEVYTVGLKPQLIEEGKQICKSIFKIAQKDAKLQNLMAAYEDYDASAYSHSFLVALFSTMICQNIEWATQRTTEIIAFGTMLHDIGKIKLPEDLIGKSEDQLTSKQFEIFKEHPRHGAEMLQDCQLVTEPIRQVVYQHHEHINGEGYPNRIPGIRIYPPAKIVALANEFANYIAFNKITPREGIKQFIQDQDKIILFDPQAIKALVQCFIRGKK